MNRVHLIAPVLWTGIHSLPDVVVYIEKLNGSRVNASRRFECILNDAYVSLRPKIWVSLYLEYRNVRVEGNTIVRPL